jgi:glycosyltransferase involved in cell wall biosynthesis
MKVSVIIPTINSESDVRILCDSVRKLRLDKKAEFIFVDSCSKDDTVSILKEFEFPKVIALDEIVSKGKARNIGIQNSTGDVIVNVDADVEFMEGWYEELLKLMMFADIAAGYTINPFDNRPLPRVSIYVGGQDITYPCCNIAYKREVFDKVGLFDETQGQAEDIELNYRCVLVGYSIIYDPKMVLIHRQRSTRTGYWKQAFWNGEARYELNRAHHELTKKHQHGVSFKNLFRLGMGVLGFIFGRFFKRPGEKVRGV